MSPLQDSEERKPSLRKLLDEEAWGEVATLFAELHPADVADLIESAPSQDHARLFTLVAAEEQPDVLAEMKAEAEEDVLESLEDTQLAKILAEMPPDDAADILNGVSESKSERVLALMQQPDSDELRDLLSYDEDSAGGIMTPDVVAMRKDQSVEEALQTIAYLESDEPVFNVNVVDQNGVLIGTVDIWELLRQREQGKTLADVADAKFVSVTTDTDQEKVTQVMSKYDLPAVPVVDEDGILKGRVTTDDAIDVMEEEASEDMFRMAGSDDSELEDSSVLHTCLVRLPWLMITLFGGFIVSLILKRFHAYISGGAALENQTLALAAFVPSVLAMGGNTAIQSSTLMVRSIALGGVRDRGVLGMLLREIAAGALMGCFCGVIIGLWATFLTRGGTAAGPAAALSPVQLAAIVAAALFCAMTFATLFGASVPIILNKVKIDPAVASGPFVTIANDISALLIYFGSTVVLVRLFGSIAG